MTHTQHPGRSTQRGAVTLIAVILLITVVLFSALTASLHVNTSIDDVLEQDNSIAALFLAETGLENAIYNLSVSNTCDNAGVGAGSTTYGRGSFEIVSGVTSGTLCQITTYGIIGFVRRTVQTDVRYGGAITFVNSSTVSGNGGTITLGVPTGVVANDFMLAMMTIRGGTGTTITAPLGWTLVPTNGRVNSGTVLAQAVYYRVAGASEPASYNWTITSDRFAAAILAYRGVNTVTPINVSAGQANAASLSATASSVTTTVGNTRLVSIFGRPNGNNTWDIAPNPASMTQQFASFGSGAGPNGAELLAADQAIATAGATGTRTATAASSLVSIGQSIALRSSGTGTGTTGVVTWAEP